MGLACARLAEGGLHFVRLELGADEHRLHRRYHRHAWRSTRSGRAPTVIAFPPLPPAASPRRPRRGRSRSEARERGKTAIELGKLRNGAGRGGGERWPRFVHDHFVGKMFSAETIAAQRERLAHGRASLSASVVTAPAELSFEHISIAKLRLLMREALAHDGMPAELLATLGPVADAQVYGLRLTRMAGAKGNTDLRQGWADWDLHSIPKPRHGGIW